jgi:hypothetical protein
MDLRDLQDDRRSDLRFGETRNQTIYTRQVNLYVN